MAKFLCHATVHTNFLEKKTLKEKKKKKKQRIIMFVIPETNVSVIESNYDLDLVSQWAYQWKMSFNPDHNKQAVQVVFSRKSKFTPKYIIMALK